MSLAIFENNLQFSGFIRFLIIYNSRIPELQFVFFVYILLINYLLINFYIPLKDLISCAAEQSLNVNNVKAFKPNSIKSSKVKNTEVNYVWRPKLHCHKAVLQDSEQHSRKKG